MRPPRASDSQAAVLPAHCFKTGAKPSTSTPPQLSQQLIDSQATVILARNRAARLATPVTCEACAAGGRAARQRFKRQIWRYGSACQRARGAPQNNPLRARTLRARARHRLQARTCSHRLAGTAQRPSSSTTGSCVRTQQQRPPHWRMRQRAPLMQMMLKSAATQGRRAWRLSFTAAHATAGKSYMTNLGPGTQECVYIVSFKSTLHYRVCSLVLLLHSISISIYIALQSVFSCPLSTHYRVCSLSSYYSVRSVTGTERTLTIECVLLLQSVFAYYRMCSLTGTHAASIVMRLQP